MSRGHGDRRDRTTVQSEAGMNRKKTRILRWRGVLADSPRMLRIMVAIVLAVAGAALTFTQLGFVAIETPSGSAALPLAPSKATSAITATAPIRSAA